MSENSISKEILDYLKSIKSKRAKTVIDYILEHGSNYGHDSSL